VILNQIFCSLEGSEGLLLAEYTDDAF